MDSSVRRRSLRPYIASACHLDYHAEDNTGPDVDSVCAQLCTFLCSHGFARPAKRKKFAKRGDEIAIGMETSLSTESNQLPAIDERKVRCDGVHLGLRSLLRLLNKRFAVASKTSSHEAKQQRLLLVLLDANFVKPTALRHVFAMLALGSNSPPFFFLPGLSASISVPLKLPRISAVTFTHNGPPEMISVLDQIRRCLKPIELIRRSNPSPMVGTSNSFVTPKLIRPAGKTKRRARRK